MTKVIAIDPGETNGVCMATKRSDGKWTLSLVEAYLPEQLFQLLENEIDVSLVIYETYRLYGSKAKTMIGNEFLTSQTIGVIRYICDKRKIICTDSPATNKSFWTDEKLRKLELYVPIIHKRDAIRHFLHWLYFISKEASLKDLL
jgi:hypothetical protein